MKLIDFMTLVSAGFYAVMSKNNTLIFTFLIGIDDLNNLSLLAQECLDVTVLKAVVKYDKVTIYLDVEL
jgi:hypothetical protein